jgi:ribosomal-protein-alanine N-acetyltransferase
MKPEIQVIPMTLEHVDAVYAAELECFSIPWPRSAFVDELTKNEYAIYFVALLDGTVAGYAGMWHVVNEGHITNIAVLPEFRRFGLGDALIEALVKAAEAREMIGITLEVRIGNLAAQRLYTKWGFKPEGFRKNYYADTKEDAIIMWKYL